MAFGPASTKAGVVAAVIRGACTEGERTESHQPRRPPSNRPRWLFRAIDR